MALALHPTKRNCGWPTGIICGYMFLMQQLTTIPVQDMPGWITFNIDGKYVYPSSGEVIETKTRKIITTLQDEFHNNVASEKMVEIDMAGNKAVRAGNQFGIGEVR